MRRERKEKGGQRTNDEIVGVFWMRFERLRPRRYVDCTESHHNRHYLTCLLDMSERNSKDWTRLRKRSGLGRKAPGDQHLLVADAGGRPRMLGSA